MGRKHRSSPTQRGFVPHYKGVGAAVCPCTMEGSMTPVTVPRDDRPTLIAISAFACILQDVLHEGLGHGVTAWLSGAQKITMSTVALQSDLDTRWISANGTLVNLVFAALFWLLLLRPQRYRPATRYFLVLAMAGNLFTGTGYFFFSGMTNFGDWAAVIRGLRPHWIWQLGLVVLGMASYYASMLVVAAQLNPFQNHDKDPRRLRGLCWTPYFTDGILAALGRAAQSRRIVLRHSASALPSTLGGECRLPESSQYDETREPQRRNASGADRGAARYMDRYWPPSLAWRLSLCWVAG